MQGIVEYYLAIGRKVAKTPTTNSGGKPYATARRSFLDWLEYTPREPKPFKSGLKENTVKGIIAHPILNIPAFIFEEDDSYVECRRCKLVGPPAFKYEKEAMEEGILKAIGLTWPDIHLACGDGFSDGEHAIARWMQQQAVRYFSQ